MSSGRQVLGQVQRSLADAQARTADLDARLGEAQGQIVKLDGARARELQALARWRVAQLAAPEGLVARLVDAETQARALLDRRDAEATALQARLAAAGTAAAELTAERTRAEDALEAAADALDAAEAATQARLGEDPAFVAQREAVRDAERVAVHADEKATASEAELEAKGRAYRDDPLFDYLWRRRYGTPAYRAGPLVRWLDGHVARLVRYVDARPNYARLLDLPVRLRAHADRVGAEADAALAELRRLEEEARAADGIPALTDARARAEARLVEIDGRIEAAATERRATLEAYEALVAGEDPHTLEAVAFLASEFGREDLQALRRAALATPMPEDDAIVARLLDLERERSAAASAVRELKEVAARDRERATDLEELRRRFTGQGLRSARHHLRRSDADRHPPRAAAQRCDDARCAVAHPGAAAQVHAAAQRPDLRFRWVRARQPLGRRRFLPQRRLRRHGPGGRRWRLQALRRRVQARRQRRRRWLPDRRFGRRQGGLPHGREVLTTATPTEWVRIDRLGWPARPDAPRAGRPWDARIGQSASATSWIQDSARIVTGNPAVVAARNATCRRSARPTPDSSACRAWLCVAPSEAVAMAKASLTRRRSRSLSGPASWASEAKRS